jgi:tetratricopeptide (TPR) repeat protein
LEVYTKEETPHDWARTQNRLSIALTAQGDFSGAADALEASLEISPTDQNLRTRAVALYEEKLFRYDRAYELMQYWTRVDATPIARLGLLEVDFTTSRFKECEKRAPAMDDAAIPAALKPWVLIRDSMKLACQWGAGETSAAQETVKALLPRAAQLQKTGWTLAGPRHFLASSPPFEAGRASWIALFESLEKGDAAAMAGDLHQLEEVMKH